MEKHRVSRLSYLFVHLHLLSFDSFSDSSHLCFSIRFKSLTSKLPSKIVLQFHQSKYNAEPLAPAPGTMIFIAMSGNMTDFRLICQSNCVPLCIFIQALDSRICSRLLLGGRGWLPSPLGLLGLLSLLGRLCNPPAIANMIGTSRRRGIQYFSLLRRRGSLGSRSRNAPSVT